MPSPIFVSNESDNTDEQRHFAREEALFLYSSGLHRKDFDAVATILGYAESDAVLEGMIVGLSPYLEASWLSGSDVLSEPDESSQTNDGGSLRHSIDRTKLAIAFDGLSLESIKQTSEDFWPVSDDTHILESEWRQFVGAATEADTHLYALYLTAMDHLDRSEYEMAERCADDAVQMALEVDDLEATAECLCLYGLIESAHAMYGHARTLFRIGLMILDEAERRGRYACNDLRVELQTAISRLDQ